MTSEHCQNPARRLGLGQEAAPHRAAHRWPQGRSNARTLAEAGQIVDVDPEVLTPRLEFPEGNRALQAEMRQHGESSNVIATDTEGLKPQSVCFVFNKLTKSALC